MKKKIIFVSIIFLILLGFYIFKRTEINNILDPNTVEVQIKNSVFEFDNIKIQDTLIHHFYIKNISNRSLKLKNVSSDCDCTITKFDKHPISKNDSAKVTVTFIPKIKGIIERNVVVEANTSPPYSVLTLKGNVK